MFWILMSESVGVILLLVQVSLLMRVGFEDPSCSRTVNSIVYNSKGKEYIVDWSIQRFCMGLE